MQTITISELKNNLSVYIDQVSHGEELLIKDDSRPLARLIPASANGDLDDDEAALVAAGVLRLPTEELTEDFWEMPAPEVSTDAILAAIKADRDER